MCHCALVAKFPNENPQTLKSVISQQYQKKVKKSYRLFSSDSKKSKAYRDYKELVSHGNSSSSSSSSSPLGVISQIARKNRFSAALTAKFIIEEWLFERTKKRPSKANLSDLTKNPLLIEDGRLSLEVSHAHHRDDNYGPIAEYIKHCIGHEYEVRLSNQIIDLDLPFLDEKEQREKGFDKTPDIKLEVPIVIDGCIINWIESKALFGDVDNHGNYLQDQLWSYWNRFGPGMVIYWFGFIDELKHNTRHSGILVADSFPSKDQITFYDPEWVRPIPDGDESEEEEQQQQQQQEEEEEEEVEDEEEEETEELSGALVDLDLDSSIASSNEEEEETM